MISKILVLFGLFASTMAVVYQPVVTEFNTFIQKYGKQYSIEEYDLRFDIFRNNLDKIRKHNAEPHSWKMVINQYADLTWEEFKRDRLGLRPILKHNTPNTLRVSHDLIRLNTQTTLPSSVDWRNKGVVNPVKDQQQCGSCWAFSTVGSIESAYAIKYGKLYSLSEQQLVDCSGSYGNYGCSGGLMDDGFQYAEDNALCSENEYPYTASDGTCRSCKGLVKVKSFVDIPQGNETALQEAIAIQPVSIAIEADTSSFQFYSSGVYDDPSCGLNLDHGVVAVGYGTENGKDYWLVRNSWGSSWGDQGYIKIARGDNRCGVSQEASYPIV